MANRAQWESGKMRGEVQLRHHDVMIRDSAGGCELSRLEDELRTQMPCSTVTWMMLR